MRAGELSAGRLALLLNAPALAGLSLVLAYPICFAGYLSLRTVSIRELRSGEFPFAGLANFARLLEDPGEVGEPGEGELAGAELADAHGAQGEIAREADRIGED